MPLVLALVRAGAHHDRNLAERFELRHVLGDQVLVRPQPLQVVRERAEGVELLVAAEARNVGAPTYVKAGQVDVDGVDRREGVVDPPCRPRVGSRRAHVGLAGDVGILCELAVGLACADVKAAGEFTDLFRVAKESAVLRVLLERRQPLPLRLLGLLAVHRRRAQRARRAHQNARTRRRRVGAAVGRTVGHVWDAVCGGDVVRGGQAAA
mmetsp:Transcript_43191/g.129637  ORF Transcript_43191/g.129637 Transcript_43191/m.129637 type:complete len:209 (-) Transcript_43191:1832-2458(-)